MKNLILLILTFLLFSINTYSQMEKGDKSVGFLGFADFSEGSSMGMIQGTFSYNISKKIRLFAGPSIMIRSSSGTPTIDPITLKITEGESSVEVTFGTSLNMEYYFSTKAKLLPFILTGIYWPDFSVGSVAVVTGGGINLFFTKNVSWKNNLELGVQFIPGQDIAPIPGVPATTSESSSKFIFRLSTGLEFKF